MTINSIRQDIVTLKQADPEKKRKVFKSLNSDQRACLSHILFNPSAKETDFNAGVLTSLHTQLTNEPQKKGLATRLAKKTKVAYGRLFQSWISSKTLLQGVDAYTGPATTLKPTKKQELSSSSSSSHDDSKDLFSKEMERLIEDKQLTASKVNAFIDNNRVKLAKEAIKDPTGWLIFSDKIKNQLPLEENKELHARLEKLDRVVTREVGRMVRTMPPELKAKIINHGETTLEEEYSLIGGLNQVAPGEVALSNGASAKEIAKWINVNEINLCTIQKFVPFKDLLLVAPYLKKVIIQEKRIIEDPLVFTQKNLGILLSKTVLAESWNLRHLHLPTLKKFNPEKALEKLTSVQIEYGLASDLSFIGRLHHLEYLKIDGLIKVTKWDKKGKLKAGKHIAFSFRDIEECIKLKSIDLSFKKYKDDEVLRNFTNLEGLLGYTISKESALLPLEHCKKLQGLHVSSKTSIKNLRNLNSLGSLTSLEIDNPATLTGLMPSSFTENLKTLYLSSYGNSLESSFKNLAFFKNLKGLKLSYCPFIKFNFKLNHLEELNLTYCIFKDKNVPNLQHFPSLKRLQLECVEISDEGFQNLGKHCKKLKTLIIDRNQCFNDSFISKNGIKAFRKTYPHIELILKENPYIISYSHNFIEPI